MARAVALAALLLLCAVAAQAARFPLEEAENGRMLLQNAKAPNCTRVNSACKSCRNQRIPGTRRSELVCSSCEKGYQLRRDGQSKTCDCAPGLSMQNGKCEPCPVGKFCAGGSAANDKSDATDCPANLATTFIGAKSQAQCFTLAGFGRVSTKGTDGKVSLTGVQCLKGTYNVGNNTAGCQKCGAGLTTADDGATSMAECKAPAGSYMDKGIGKLCQRGTYSTDLNTNANCVPCPTGITTELEGSTSAAACSLALKGNYINPLNSNEALACPRDTYQDQEIATTTCKACPNEWRTKETGATGVALCLAPPGWQQVAEGANITECPAGSYKADWNRNPCVACGTGLITLSTGSVSKDACLVPAGWGLVSPTEAAKCDKNTYGDAVNRTAVANARCTPCPAGMFTLDTLDKRTIGAAPAPANELYTSESACLVEEGWGTTSTLPQKCPVGTYNAGKNREACMSCGTGWTTVGDGKTSAAACVVQPGWRMDTSNGIPAPCDKGSYSVGGTEAAPNATCTSCPPGFTTQEDESTTADECTVCKAGFGGANCDVCPYNTFASGGAKAADDSPCVACASNAVSKRGATQVQQCYSSTVDARNDVFNVADEAAWVVATNVKTGAGCSSACTGSASCVMYKFVGQDNDPNAVCSTYAEATGTDAAFNVGFKIGNGDDYAVWGSKYKVGAAIATPAAATEAACLAECSANAECEVYNWDAAASNKCTLTKSELEESALSMFQVRGAKLFSDRP
uniref:Tyrosine-protein kinase ephrin type A/B receptor-like domain-containing protein n=1 Tax=Tetradesmus obliquus TaxID=3088 RepID=A0A383V609_TETOB|eukprot:jgi/Sobl393_1/17061/SZX60531.1